MLDLGPEAPREEERALALVDSVERHAPELTPWLPLLGTVLDVDLPATPEIEAIDPQYLPNRVREVVATFLNAVLPAHVVVIVEDAHWMDDASSEVLELIVRAVHTRSALGLRHPARPGERRGDRRAGAHDHVPTRAAHRGRRRGGH